MLSLVFSCRVSNFGCNLSEARSWSPVPLKKPPETHQDSLCGTSLAIGIWWGSGVWGAPSKEGAPVKGGPYQRYEYTRGRNENRVWGAYYT